MKPDYHLIPLVLGVTGHRDLRPEDRDRLKDKVRSVLQDLQTEFARRPLLLLSPLAEGADRLVAEVALELGAELIAPLPLPREEYEKDFETEASRSEFAHQLGQARAWFDLPLVEGNTLQNIRGYDEADEILIHLGQEALAENGDWVLLHRDRPLRIQRG